MIRLPLKIPNPIVTTYDLKSLPAAETERVVGYLTHQHGNLVVQTKGPIVTIGYHNTHQKQIAEVGLRKIVGEGNIQAVKGAA